MEKSRILFIITIFLIFASTLQILAQKPVQVESYLSENEIIIGDQVKLNYRITLHEELDFYMPYLTDTITANLEILSWEVDTIKTEAGLEIDYSYIISAYDSGYYEIPPYFITYEFQGQKDSVATAGMTLFADYQQITDDLAQLIDTAATEPILDIKSPRQTPFSAAEVWAYVKNFLRNYWPYVLLGLGVLAVLLYFLVFRSKQELAVEKEIPREPAHIIAVRNLDLLKDRQLWQQDKVKEYHSELSEIVRQYLEDRYGIMALELTSNEVFISISNAAYLSAEQFDWLKSILQVADMVKFAKWRPLPNENERSMTLAYQLINETRLVAQTVKTEKVAEEVVKSKV